MRCVGYRPRRRRWRVLLPVALLTRTLMVVGMVPPPLPLRAAGRMAADEILAAVFGAGPAESADFESVFESVFPHSETDSETESLSFYNLHALERAGRPGRLPASASARHVFRRHAASRDDVLSVLRRSHALANNGTFLGGPLRQHEDFNIVKLTRSKQDGELWSGALPLPSTTPLGANLAAEALRRGFTLLLNKANHRLAPLHSLSVAMEDLYAQSIGLRMSPRCNVNVYLTDRNAQGFEAHFDWMDVMVLQVEGTKTWTLYEATPHRGEWELRWPRVDQKFKPAGAFLDTLAKREVRMGPGDVLFLPAGVMHEAKCTDDDSMHISLGIEVDEEFTWGGLLHFAIRSSSSNYEKMGEHRRNDKGRIRMLLHAAVTRASRKASCLRDSPRSSWGAGGVVSGGGIGNGMVAYPCGTANGMLSGNALTVASLLEYLADGNNAGLVANVALASGAPEEEVASMLKHHTVGGSFHSAVTRDTHATTVALRAMMEGVMLEGLEVGAVAMLGAHRARKSAWRENRDANVARHQQKVTATGDEL
jgi:hypothetical protein